MAREMRKPYPSEEQDRFMVRLPNGMRDDLKRVSEANKRTMNAEIVARLEASLNSEEDRLFTTGGVRPAIPMPDYEKRLSSLEAAVLGVLDEMEKFRQRLDTAT